MPDCAYFGSDNLFVLVIGGLFPFRVAPSLLACLPASLYFRGTKPHLLMLITLHPVFDCFETKEREGGGRQRILGERQFECYLQVMIVMVVEEEVQVVSLNSNSFPMKYS